MSYLKLFLACFLALIVICGSEVKAQPACESGWTQGSFVVMVGYCEYRIWFCYKCEAIGPGGSNEFSFNITKFMPRSSNCTKPTEQVLIAAETKLIDRDFVRLMGFCDIGEIEPCNGTGMLFHVFSSVCWMKVQDLDFLPDIVISHQACPGNAKCVRTWEICWDDDLQKYIYNWISGPFVVGTPACPAFDPVEPDIIPPATWTDCFELVSPCNSPDIWEDYYGMP